MDSFAKFDNRLKIFVDKYYKITLLKGIILFIVLFSTIVMLFSLLEFLAWFNHSVRLFLLLTGLVSSLFIFNYFVLIPILRYLGIFKRLTKRNTEKIIRQNLPDVHDYVLNIIELQELGNNSDANSALVQASIEQKILMTNAFNFQNIITPRRLFPFINYFLIIGFLYALIFLLKPSIVSQGTTRIINYKEDFVKDLGYSIIVNESALLVEKGDDLLFEVTIEGEKLPDYISYFIGKNEFLMIKKDSRNYYSNIKNINHSFALRVGNERFKTRLYNVTVVQPPMLEKFVLHVKYPQYINKVDESFAGISNLKVPVGSAINFNFECLNTDTLVFKTDSEEIIFLSNRKVFIFDTMLTTGVMNYSVYGKNSNLTREIVPKSIISTIPDLFPEISVIQAFDANNKKLAFFKGHVFDDYGLSQLYMVVNNKKFPIAFNTKINNQDFFFSFEFSDPNQKTYSYYFEVFDNDAINGSKSARTAVFDFEIPDYNKLAEFNAKQDDEIFMKMEKSLLLAEEFKKDLEYSKMKIYSEDLSAFEKQQLVNDLKNKQEMLEDMLNDFSIQNKNKNNQFNSFSKQDEELLKKQQQIQKLMDEVMTDELRALLDELQKLSMEFNKNELNKNLDKLEMNYDQLSEQLDKNLELLKKYEIEKNLDIISKEIKNISNNQKQLADNYTKTAIDDSLANSDFEMLKQLQKDYEDLIKDNKSLNKPLKLDNFASDFENLKNELDSSKMGDNNTSKEKKEKFSKNSDLANDLSNKIQNLINNNRAMENAENGETLRQILENLLYFSFTQESINEAFLSYSKSGSTFNENVKRQNSMVELFSIINDSLISLSKRTPQLGGNISKKVYTIESSLYDMDVFIKESNLGACRLEQRKVIELTNDLVLLLSESLTNMDNSGEGGEGSPSKKNKPKQSKPSMSEMRKSQENMKSQLENMIKQMKDGKPGSGKPNSQQLGKMLAQQEMFQQMLNQLQNSNGVGAEMQKKLNEINQLLEQNKRDIIKQNISSETLFRQNQIVTRLLEAENSDLEREYDNKRKSTEATDYLKRNPEEFFKLEKGKTNFNDILNSNSIKMNYFYKNKYQNYIKSLN